MATKVVGLMIYFLLLVITYSILQLVQGSETYVVGEDDGWNLYTDYSEWARGIQFHVGDVLGKFPLHMITENLMERKISWKV